jgi:hypothetical protein
VIRALGIVFTIMAAAPAWAQSPRAGGPSPSDEPGSRIAAELALTGNLARGLVDRDLISTRGIFQVWRGPLGFYIQPYWLYGRVATPMGKLTTDNEIYVRTGLFRSLTERFFAYGVNVYDRSVRRRIDHRDLLGGGAGVIIIKGEEYSLHTSFGVLGEITKFDAAMLDSGETVDGARTVARFSGRIYGRYKLAEGKLALVHDLIVVPAFAHPITDYRILFYGAIDAPIAKGFSVRVQADATREGKIVAGTKHDDLVVTFGLAYRNEWTPVSQSPDR